MIIIFRVLSAAQLLITCLLLQHIFKKKSSTLRLLFYYMATSQCSISLSRLLRSAHYPNHMIMQIFMQIYLLFHHYTITLIIQCFLLCSFLCLIWSRIRLHCSLPLPPVWLCWHGSCFGMLLARHRLCHVAEHKRVSLKYHIGVSSMQQCLFHTTLYIQTLGFVPIACCTAHW